MKKLIKAMIINQLKTKKGYCLVLLLLAMACSVIGKGQTVRDYSFYYSKGNALLEKKKGKDAISMFDSTLQFQPKNPDAYIGRGTGKIYYYMPEEGLMDYDTAILYAEKKDKLGYYRKKENALESEKLRGYYNDNQKLAIYNEAIAAFPDSPMAYMDREVFYLTSAGMNRVVRYSSKIRVLAHESFHVPCITKLINKIIRVICIL